jgi:uncharacterized membrane protein YeaQ/YmgE (transglycosylase-associated protein family)
MSIVAWAVLGLISGFTGNMIVNKTGEGFLVDMVLGILGAVGGGFLFRMLGANGTNGANAFSVWSLLLAVIGATLLLVIKYALLGRCQTNTDTDFT